MTTLSEAVSQVPGVVGVAARHLETGKVIEHNADTVFFTASTFKVPILAELYRQVDAGTLDLSQRVELTDILRVPGSGVLRELGSGLAPNLHDLAMLMIIVSDNLATDILYHTVGKDNLNRTMADLGLSKTKLPMSCRDLLFSLAGLTVSESLDDFWEVSDRVEQGYRGLSPDCDALNEEKSDVSSPADMVRLLEIVHNGDFLSEGRGTECSTSSSARSSGASSRTTCPRTLSRPTRREASTASAATWESCGDRVGRTPWQSWRSGSTDSTDLDPKLARISRIVFDEMAG